MEHHSYSLFCTELKEDTNVIGEYNLTPHFELIQTFNKLESAKEFQTDWERRYKLNTIIIPTY